MGYIKDCVRMDIPIWTNFSAIKGSEISLSDFRFFAEKVTKCSKIEEKIAQIWDFHQFKVMAYSSLRGPPVVLVILPKAGRPVPVRKAWRSFFTQKEVFSWHPVISPMPLCICLGNTQVGSPGGSPHVLWSSVVSCEQ